MEHNNNDCKYNSIGVESPKEENKVKRILSPLSITVASYETVYSDIKALLLNYCPISIETTNHIYF